MTCQDRRDLMPMYVADALDAGDREALRGHLATGCAACAGHLAEARTTFACLALALDPVLPPPDLLRRVVDRIDAAQAPAPPSAGSSFWRLVPLAAAAAVLAAVTTYAVVDRRDRAALADAQLAYNTDARAALLQSALVDRDEQVKQLGRTLADQKQTLAALQGDRARATLLQATLADRDRTLEQLRRRLAEQQQLADALQSKDARVIELAGAGQPTASARLVWSPAAGRSVLLARNLAAPPPGRAYELWFITADQKKVPAATFGVDVGGTTTVVAPIPAGLTALAVAAVTDEPAGGVAVPTGTIQMAGKAP